MSTVVLQRLSMLSLTVKQLGSLPCLSTSLPTLPRRAWRWLWKVIYRPMRQSGVPSWWVTGKLRQRILMKTNKGGVRRPPYVHIQLPMFKGISCVRGWSVGGVQRRKNQSLLKESGWGGETGKRIDLMNADSCPAAGCNPLRIIEHELGGDKKTIGVGSSSGL